MINIGQGRANRLLQPIAEILSASPGIEWNEYRIIQQLVAEHWVADDYGRTSMGLFQTHFLVMNALYQLQKDFWRQGRGYLTVSALSIVLHPLEDSSSTSLQGLPAEGEGVGLDAYYLDWQHFSGATEESVDNMLNQFWERYFLADDQREALQLLELDSTVNFADIQRRYRQLAMTWHPDRGGSHEKLVSLNRAFETLKRYYRT